MSVHPVTRYLGKLNSPSRPHLPPDDNEAVILWAIVVHWWAWCREQAKAGWIITLIAAMVLFVVYSLLAYQQTADLLHRCLGVQ